MGSKEAPLWTLLIGLVWAADFREVVASTEASVASLEVRGRRGADIRGSGFVVGDGTILATNHHVVDGSRSIVAVFGDERVTVRKVLATDPDADLALLLLPSQFPALRTAKPPAVGAPVLAAGNPRGLGLSYTDGILSQEHNRNALVVLQHSAPISPGNSGGPLLNEEGHAVGVNSFQIASEYGQNLNFAVAAEHLDALLKAHHRPRTLEQPEAVVAKPAEPWTPPAGQPLCTSPQEPTWPFEPPVALHTLDARQNDDRGVCRQGVSVAYGRYTGVDAIDSQLADKAEQMGFTRAVGDDCTSRWTQTLDNKTSDVVAVRSGTTLWLYLRGEGALCDRAEQLRVAASR
jgi:hypothetical protein